jgi:Co/Zn/Cd efflux system component
MKLVDYTAEILVATVAIFFLWGIGYIIQIDQTRQFEFKQQCIAAGMVYVGGNCLK